MAADQTFLSISEVAALFEVSDVSVRRWVKSGRLKAVRLPSGIFKVRREDVEAILDADPAGAGAA